MTEDELNTAVCDAMEKNVGAWLNGAISDAKMADAVLAVCRPIIEAQERERCARIAEGRYWSSALGTEGIPKAIAAVIRETGE